MSPIFTLCYIVRRSRKPALNARAGIQGRSLSCGKPDFGAGNRNGGAKLLASAESGPRPLYATNFSLEWVFRGRPALSAISGACHSARVRRRAVRQNHGHCRRVPHCPGIRAGRRRRAANCSQCCPFRIDYTFRAGAGRASKSWSMLAIKRLSKISGPGAGPGGPGVCKQRANKIQGVASSNSSESAGFRSNSANDGKQN